MKKKILLISAISICVIATIFMITYNNNDINLSNLNNSNSNETSNENEYTVSSYITADMQENLQILTTDLYLNHEYTPSYLNEISDNIAIVKVISLDSASTEYNQMVGMTYGKLLINTSIKGNLTSDTVIDYAKPGVIMSLAEWEKTQPVAANEKRKFVREQNGSNIDTSKIYVDLKIEDDISIEEGKTYLVYLKYSNSMKRYEIIGLENGLREVNIPKVEEKLFVTNLNTNELQIKNNHTNEYESLQKYINDNITKK